MGERLRFKVRSSRIVDSNMRLSWSDVADAASVNGNHRRTFSIVNTQVKKILFNKKVLSVHDDAAEEKIDNQNQRIGPTIVVFHQDSNEARNEDCFQDRHDRIKNSVGRVGLCVKDEPCNQQIDWNIYDDQNG